jgi:ABC-2 type transport system ATP-binding protein
MAELRHLTRTSVNARLERQPAGLEQVAGVHDLRQTGDLLSAQVDASSMGEFIGTLAGFGVMSLESRPPTLEDLFLRHYSHDST